MIENSQTYGVSPLEAAKKAGVTLITGAPVDDLTVDDGRVSRVQVTRGGKTSTVAARVAVVLASGDFSAGISLRDANLSLEAATALPINQDGLGLGHEFAIEHGAGTKNMDMLFGPQLRFPVPKKGGFLDRLATWKWLCQIEALIVGNVPTWMLKPVVKLLLVAWMSHTDDLFRSSAILVNSRGKRFGKDDKPASEPALQDGSTGFIVIGVSNAKKFDGDPHCISTAPGIAFAYFSGYGRGHPEFWVSVTKRTAHSLKPLGY